MPRVRRRVQCDVRTVPYFENLQTIQYCTKCIEVQYKPQQPLLEGTSRYVLNGFQMDDARKIAASLHGSGSVTLAVWF